MRNLPDFNRFENKTKIQANKYAKENLVIPPELEAERKRADSIYYQHVNIVDKLRKKFKCPAAWGSSEKCTCDKYPEIKEAALIANESAIEVNRIFDIVKKLEQNLYNYYFDRAISGYKAKERFLKLLK